MSDYQEYLAEREQIDLLIGEGYQIEHVTENLSGAFVDFKSKKAGDMKQLHIKTADGRKYFSVILINRNR
ncbi:hypothetical protein [Peribacillus glennii]|uniref:Uncharacterized protein n=1 Tax=Peribacillus glennii TaxID=2303991 RepID=A0A372LH41_9BACI|nr:hypothetical protein [Peribacillus glennii]RFU64936.1 hypothetical protein D0466_03195 [Peribacillus glennii]